MDEKFDLKQLIKIEDLDIRLLADQDEHLTVYGYFNRVEYFLQKTPLFVKSIGRLTNVSNKNNFLSELEGFSNLLTLIGSNDLPPIITDMIKAVKDDDLRTRNQLIKSLSDHLNTLVTRVKYAYLADNLDLEPDERVIAEAKKVTEDRYADSASQTLQSNENRNTKTLKEALDEYENRHKHFQILAVDDMPDILNVVKGMLSDTYKVFVLTKGEQVQKFLETHTPDLFLLDIEMPGLDGYALFSLIRTMEAHKDTPIIFLTGNATSEYLHTAIRLGVSDFIKKPFEKETLLKKIQCCLERRQ